VPDWKELLECQLAGKNMAYPFGSKKHTHQEQELFKSFSRKKVTAQMI
tara:strand:- start:357 stop:500 length:144 start_codon:yes stop_codon:yes gene_type:complete